MKAQDRNSRTILGVRGGQQDLLAIPNSLGKSYSSMLNSNPILTKSLTSGVIFALSDISAQKIESSSSTNSKLNVKRTVYSVAVGSIFGVAAHHWYGLVFRLMPDTTLLSTLKKAALGQIFFGPSLTCVFFASALLQSGSFTFKNWFRQIRADLPGVWISGLGFWPIVDLISYSFIKEQWILLFVNFCSFIWTIYVSMVANRQQRVPKQ